MRIVEPPPNLSPADAKVFKARAYFLLVGVVICLALIPSDLILHAEAGIVIQLCSAVAFLTGLILLHTGRPGLGTFLGFATAVVAVPLSAVLFGTKNGGVTFNAAIAMGAALVYPASQHRARLGVFAATLASTLAVLAIGRWGHPLVLITPPELEVAFWVNTTAAIGGVLGLTYVFAAASDGAEKRIEEERQRSERLLRNILPGPIAERLKRDEGTIADAHPMVTVLFADLVGFTAMSQRIGSAELVELLNEVFSAFDRIAERFEIEKIKTIGDAYMAVSGLASPQTDHAARAADMALAMREALRTVAVGKGAALEVRIGIHSGPVVAGVIGQKKFAYDVWGDTVNTASRMESHGLPGEIHVSEATRQLLSDGHVVEDRGVLPIKGKGEMRTFLLRARSAPATGG